MQKHGALIVLIAANTYANPVLVHREEIENTRTEDGRDIKIQYFVTQHCGIENNQSNKMSTPLFKQNTEEPPLNEKTTSWSYKSLLVPAGVSSLGCLGYGIYYTFSKFNLFTLNKACLKTTGWSMWKKKLSGNFDEIDEESDLLVDILNTYQTDKYATAIARFMQDVDEEYNLLQTYVQKAEAAQSSIFRFAYGDVTHDILQAKARIATLDELKRTVLGWLKKKSCYVDQRMSIRFAARLRMLKMRSAAPGAAFSEDWERST